MSLKDEFDDLANELMNGDFVEAKYPLTLTNADTDYDPVTGLSTGGSSQSLTATMIDFNSSQFDGDNIKIGDKQVIIWNKELSINILNNVTSFEFDLSSVNGGVTSGRVVNSIVDPLGVTTTLQLRS
jgi:hypothetical protein